MKLVVFGLTVSSTWGNGHATLWRGLCRALGEAGHHVVFFEKDVPYYAAHRDLEQLSGGSLVLYPSWGDILPRARAHVAEADVAIVTSFCPDGIAATGLVLDHSRGARLFYDLDTPVTLSALDAGKELSYIGPTALEGFDLVLSFTGGEALVALTHRLGAKQVAPLYGHVDPLVHRPAAPEERFHAEMSYLGTYSEDRSAGFDALFLEPARRTPTRRFTLGGSMYPGDITWPRNVARFEHLAPAEHPAFFCSSRMTLNITRRTMARMGYCPSGRLFEAAACGVPIVSDGFEGIEQFFEPDREILLVRDCDDVIETLCLEDAELERIAEAARDRVLSEHTAAARAQELLRLLSAARARTTASVVATPERKEG